MLRSPHPFLLLSIFPFVMAALSLILLPGHGNEHNWFCYSIQSIVVIPIILISRRWASTKPSFPPHNSPPACILVKPCLGARQLCFLVNLVLLLWCSSFFQLCFLVNLASFCSTLIAGVMRFLVKKAILQVYLWVKENNGCRKFNCNTVASKEKVGAKNLYFLAPFFRLNITLMTELCFVNYLKFILQGLIL